MKDTHVVRYISSLITISEGKVTDITRPVTTGCRMACFLYRGLKDAAMYSPDCLKEEIKKVIEEKIARFGFCTKNRMVWQEENSIPYGASEIMAYGLREKIIDGVVTVCDGAGTVVTSLPQIVQGIGARMHTVLQTSFIPEVAAKLRRHGCQIPGGKGLIDQATGVVAAAENGHVNIAVTVCAFDGEDLRKIRRIEKERRISVTILAVCTTGVDNKRLMEIEKYADMAWACNSADVRKRLGVKAVKTLSSASPVYILTKKGESLVSGYRPGMAEIRQAARLRIQ